MKNLYFCGATSTSSGRYHVLYPISPEKFSLLAIGTGSHVIVSDDSSLEEVRVDPFRRAVEPRGSAGIQARRAGLLPA